MSLEIIYKHTKLSKHIRTQINVSCFIIIIISIITAYQIRYPLAIFPLNFSYKTKIRKLGLAVFISYWYLRKIYFLLLFENI